MSKLTATLIAAFLFVSCSDDKIPDQSLPCEGEGYYDPETHYCYQEVRPICKDKNNCVTGDETCTIISAAQKGHTYEIICKSKHIGYLDNGKPGEKGESGLDGTKGENCSIASTGSGVEITCGIVNLPLSHGNVGTDGEDGKHGTNGESCKIAQADKGVEITCGTVDLPLTLLHGIDGINAENGTKGDDCTITETSTGVEITCGTVPLSLNRGTDGGKGDKGDTGDAGKGCTIAPADKNWEITCDKVVTLKNGEDGKPASEITIGVNGYWYIDGKDTGVKVTGNKGDNCTVEDKGDRVEMTCGTKTVDWPKAMCMATPYDPAKQFCDSRDYKTYKYVEIEDQTWMAENLNYDTKTTPTSSWCYGDNTGGDSQNRCGTYGRLYMWYEANEVCPAGWHLPSQAEWYALVEAAGGEDFAGVGENLKAASGFAALLGGYGTSNNFSEVSSSGWWWSSTQHGNYSYFRMYINNSGTIAFRTSEDIYFRLSVRCVKDEFCGGEIYDSGAEFCYNGTRYDRCYYEAYDPAKQFCSSSEVYDKCGGEVYTPWTEFCYNDEIYDKCNYRDYDPAKQFCDSRDYKIYKYVEIGDQTWMAENLNYNADGSRCYGDNTGGDSQNRCGTYGRMYDWATAMAACPAGWHLPSQAEWNALNTFIESNKGCSDCDAEHLKAKEDWNSNGKGEDSYGFSALPGGSGNSGGSFNGVGSYGHWWSASESDSFSAYRRYMYYNSEYAFWSDNDKNNLYSVRCMRDD